MTNPYVKNPPWADGSGGGTPINAAKLNNYESGIFDAHYAPAVRVYHNTTQSIPNTTLTALAFNSERFDQASNVADTMHDTVTNNSRLTCRYAGIYQITVNVQWAGNATGIRDLEFDVNGAAINAPDSVPAIATFQYQTNTTLWSLAVNDYVQVFAYQSSSAALNVTAAEFMMFRAG